jgi:hypothetical protein
MAIPQWDYLLPLAVSHGLVSVAKKMMMIFYCSFRNKI